MALRSLRFISENGLESARSEQVLWMLAVTVAEREAFELILIHDFSRFLPRRCTFLHFLHFLHFSALADAIFSIFSALPDAIFYASGDFPCILHLDEEALISRS